MPRALVLAASLAALLLSPATARGDINEGFESVPPAGWSEVNNSSPAGDSDWGTGDAASAFPSQAGPPDAYAFSTLYAVNGSGTLSNWLISPPQAGLSNGDTYSFYSRVAEGGSERPDRLQLRLSTDGTCSPGSGPTSIGSFDVLLEDINPDLTNLYPEQWTQFSGVLNGLPPGELTGCFAFRHFVTGGGVDGPNSNLVGVDTFTTFATTPSNPGDDAACNKALAKVADEAADARKAKRRVGKAKKKLNKAKRKGQKRSKVNRLKRKLKQAKRRHTAAKRDLARAKEEKNAVCT